VALLPGLQVWAQLSRQPCRGPRSPGTSPWRPQGPSGSRPRDLPRQLLSCQALASSPQAACPWRPCTPRPPSSPSSQGPEGWRLGRRPCRGF